MIETKNNLSTTLNILKYLKEIAFIFDARGNILHHNSRFEDVFELTPDNTINLFELWQDEPNSFIENISNNQEFATSFKIHTKNSLIELSGKIIPINDHSSNLFIALLENTNVPFSDNSISNIYYEIGNLTKTSDNLENLLKQIHNLLKREIDANNMIVCFDNKQSNQLDFVYNVDEELNGKQAAYTYSRQKASGLTEYILRTKKAHFLKENDIISLVNQGLVKPLGEIPKIWLGVPMIYDNEQIGVLAVKSHSNPNKFNLSDLELLKFITVQISFALQRKKFEDQITDQRARLESIIESGDHLVWSVNVKRQLTSFNKSYSDVIEKIHGKKPNLIEHSDEIILLSDKKFEELISSKYDLAFKGEPQHYETSFEEEDGAITWRNMFLNPIYTKKGTIEQISGIAHDITKRKIAELKVQENERKFRNIFESFQDIYINVNGRDEIETISPSVKEITGFTQEEMLGKNVRDFFHPKEENDLHNLKAILDVEKSIKNFEVNLIKKDGSTIPSIANLRAVLNNHNKTIGLQGVVRDINELQTITEELRSAKQDAEYSLKIKENFLANMSHEIRTPMNGIVAMIDLLGNSKLNQQQKSYISTVKESSTLLLNILNDILDLSKLEAGKMDIRQEKVQVNEILQQTYLLFSQRAKAKNITFNFYNDPNIPQYLISDETRIIQILSNLVSNAIKFTDKKGEVSLTTKHISDENNIHNITFTVKDTGIGISEENLTELFTSFNQLDSSITKNYGGTGLGLSISRELCQLLGSDISVKSEKEKGSTFYFTLSMPTTENRVSKKDNLTVQEEKRNLKNLNILIVDDIKINRKVCRILLEEEQAIVHSASNGKEALNLVHSNRFDVVLMDIQMPVMDGVTAFLRMKDMAVCKRTKFIATTAFSMENDKLKYLDIGFNNYLSKPINRSKLIKSILDEPDVIQLKTTIIQTAKQMFEPEQRKSIMDLGGNTLFIELLSDFKTEATDQIKELIRAAENNNFEEVKQYAHSIKGSASSVSLKAISETAKNIEQEIIKNKKSNIADLTIEISKEYERFVNWLNKQ